MVAEEANVAPQRAVETYASTGQRGIQQAYCKRGSSEGWGKIRNWIAECYNSWQSCRHFTKDTYDLGKSFEVGTDIAIGAGGHKRKCWSGRAVACVLVVYEGLLRIGVGLCRRSTIPTAYAGPNPSLRPNSKCQDSRRGTTVLMIEVQDLYMNRVTESTRLALGDRYLIGTEKNGQVRLAPNTNPTINSDKNISSLCSAGRFRYSACKKHSLCCIPSISLLKQSKIEVPWHFKLRFGISQSPTGYWTRHPFKRSEP
ncbi:hypothetical protein BDP27DRAFT_1374769 [Rhodocollybia butyracea]|uniref:Uncharacterized protein n=1 Tax=Rhodocollybia butyracea TaxID=206335 RepID=A0A9P5P1N6_9AGAR|nr:hypothetical protein BDP27DRAFT_1374769 [Rhodocollybia butyracea]